MASRTTLSYWRVCVSNRKLRSLVLTITVVAILSAAFQYQDHSLIVEDESVDKVNSSPFYRSLDNSNDIFFTRDPYFHNYLSNRGDGDRWTNAFTSSSNSDPQAEKPDLPILETAEDLVQVLEPPATPLFQKWLSFNLSSTEHSEERENWRRKLTFANLDDTTTEEFGGKQHSLFMTSEKSAIYTSSGGVMHEDILRKLVPYHRSTQSQKSERKNFDFFFKRNTKPIHHPQTSSLLEKRTTYSVTTSSGSKNVIAPTKSTYNSRWTRITDDLFIYSSYWDDRKDLANIPFSRTLGILRYNEKFTEKKGFRPTGELRAAAANVICNLWHVSSKKPVMGKLSISFFEEGLNSFIGVFLKCTPHLPALHSDYKFENVSQPSAKANLDFYAVSFTPIGSSDYPHKLNYFENPTRTLKKPKSNSNSAVCVRPMYGPYDDVQALLQFIIYYFGVLKVHQFYLYDLAMSHFTRQLLTKLQTLGVQIEVLPWNIPTGSWSELWDYGSLTALNDCVYRAINKHDYVVIVDVDEFIVPKTKPTTIEDIYETVLRQKGGNRGDAALVPNAFFCSEFEGNVSPRGKMITGSPSYRFKLPLFRRAIREGRAWPAADRSKMILTPSTVVSVGHHLVHHFVNSSHKNLGGSTLHVLLNHYRDCQGLHHGLNNTGHSVLGQPTTRDTTVFQYRDTFMKDIIFKLFQSLLL
ncbi:Glycosyltransferase family 92 [Trinorchestia longiramus]|nr:Glycosyltransferase family 92 [Trinorchestia longiramus]